MSFPRPAILFGALLMLSLPADLSAQETPSFQGTWTVQGAGGATARRNSAVERATADMSIFTRGIARRRLRRGTPIHRRLVISGEGASFRARVGGYDLNFPADGRARPFTDPFDNDMRASQRINGRTLRQVMRSDDATLTHTLQLSRDGSEITLTVRIASHHLPGDVVFRVWYRRA